MTIFRPVHFVSDQADDLEEAIRIALRKSAIELDPERFRHRRHWHFYAPREWRIKVEYAAAALVKKVRGDLKWVDAMRREDEARCERIISLLLDAMRSDVFMAASLIEQIEAHYTKARSHARPSRASGRSAARERAYLCLTASQRSSSRRCVRSTCRSTRRASSQRRHRSRSSNAAAR